MKGMDMTYADGNSWYRLSLKMEQVAGGEVEERSRAFDGAFTRTRAPRVMALFRQEREDGGTDLFYTPETAVHAPELLGECTPCARPAMTRLHLLVGHNEITYYLP